jgi:Putative transposase/Transposase zinc-binding domain
VNRPPFEVADIIRAAGNNFLEKNRSWLTGLHRKVLSAIERCRTAALGGHRDQCSRCGYQTAISYNSCRNRHCPKCQTNARNRWLAARQRELLAVPYVHVVFTLPHELALLALYNKKILYTLLFRASAATLLEIAADPKHLGAEIGFLSVLHTWGQNLLLHPHVHCVIPAGGLSPDHKRWVHPRYPFFLPVKVLSRVFRGKFVSGLKQAFQKGDLCLPGALQPLKRREACHCFLRTLFRQDWVVYAKPPFGGPEHVLHYLARYTHRVAISNRRLMTLSVEEFLRRFLLHVLPKGFIRIRFFGLLANRRRAALLPLCRTLLGDNSSLYTAPPSQLQNDKSSGSTCPLCGGPMVVIERLTAGQISMGLARHVAIADTS